MGQFINSFGQGLDQDSSKNRFDDVHYFSAENIRPITQEGLSSGAIENLLGNVHRLECSETVDNIVKQPYYVVGYTILRDYIILFTSTNNTSVPTTVSTDRIWKVPISEVELSGVSFKTLNTDWFHLGGNLIYSGNLEFCTGNKIKAVGRYENSNIQKVYWVDGYNNLRHINTVYDANLNDLTSLSLDKLEVISDFEITRPEISGFGAGNLRAGKVQYVYQLYVLNGGETTFSPASHLINVTEYNEQDSTTDAYKGSNLDVNTGKAVIGEIEVDALGYNRIRIVAIHYTTLQGDPQIRIVDEKEISSSGGTVNFVDAGQSLGSLTLEQIRILGTYLFSPKELGVKDNILFPANITEKSFDINFDARAYRFAGASSVSTEPNYQPTSALRRRCRIYDEEGGYYEGNGLNPTGFWSKNDLSGTVSGWTNIPETYDAINRFNDIDNDGDSNYRFMYQADGVTLGGEGPYVKYSFKMKTVELDDNSGARNIRTGLEGSNDNPSFNNYASPYRCAQHLGYARDEVYRFGIVFFDDKGRSSFVKWIGDIRMPSISTEGVSSNYDPDGGVQTWQTSTIAFTDYYAAGANYYVTIDNDPVPTGFSSTITESSPLDVMTATLAALSTFSDITITNVDIEGYTFDITYETNNSHSLQIVRLDPVSMTALPITYSETIIVPYAPLVGTRKDYSYVYYDSSVQRTKMNILYLQFNVNLTGTEAEGLSYQIVRVKRESDDRSIRAQGMVTGTRANGNDRNPYSWTQDTNWDNSVICFNSPEIAFNKNLSRQAGDKLQIVGVYTNYESYSGTGIYVNKYRGVTALSNPQTDSASAVLGDEQYEHNVSEIDGSTLVTMDTSESFIGSINYKREIHNNAGVDLEADKGVNVVCDLNSTSWIGYNVATANRQVVNYRRNVFAYQYGGNTYEARSRNTYMATGRVQTSNYARILVYDGDTYISMFDYLHAGWREESVTGRCEVGIFPVETSINLDLRTDIPYHAARLDVPVFELRLIRESKGLHDDTNGNTYAQLDNLYIYNTVYSKENTTKIHLIRPFDWREQIEFDTRILSSNVKTNNELSDSWLSYGVNAYIDVDPQYGELTALINVNDRMLFFQPKAFGVLSVNERALLQTSTISQLSLGTSGVLARFDYAKTEMGASDKDHIVLTQNGLYWVDVINKAMYKYTSGPEELSLMKGMSSWFRNNITASSSLLLFNDPMYKEVSVVSAASNLHLVYNEITDAFTSFYTFYPSFVINYNDKVLSSSDRLNFYRHNDSDGTRGVFYDGATVPSNITLIVNPEPLATKVFNNLEWLSEVYDGSNNIYNETLTSLTINNDYQGTGEVTLDSRNMRRRLRRWRHTIGRAAYTETGAAQTRLDSRIRDSYMKLKLEFDNVSTHKFILHDVITSYMVTNR